MWLRPAPSFTGNHIFVAGDSRAFDYHGYSARKRFLRHTLDRARRRWPGWRADLIELPAAILVSEVGSRTYDGLRLREPKQFLHDAMPRAMMFLERFPAPAAVAAIGQLPA